MPSESVRVMVRVRPLNAREKAAQTSPVVETDTNNMQVILTKPNEADTQKIFSYDAVFAPNVKQQTVYEQAAFSLVESVLSGYNGTIFAYGQTGCGKTHTMLGVPDDDEAKGIIPRAFTHIFGNIESTEGKSFLIRCSYIEIYNEEVHDLLGNDVHAKMEVKESTDKGVFIKNLSTFVVKSVQEIEKYMALGSKNRQTAETAMNKDSSRSHSIFTIYIESSEIGEKGKPLVKLGKLNLVDLAGSERQSKTGATGDRLKEANKINLSLSALGNVISALVDGKSSHVPYRDSKLTRLLQDSLGGNTKTVMIANVSPASDSYDETLGTLRYASRAKNIKNQPRINEDPKDAMLREYAEEIKRLKSMLEAAGTSGESYRNERTGSQGTNEEGSRENGDIRNLLKAKEEEIDDERKKREELEKRMKEIEQNFIRGGIKEGAKEPGEKKKYKEMVNRLKEQEEKHEELIREKERKEEEILMAERKYASLQEEVVEQRQVIKKLRKKYRDAQKEIKDLEREHEIEKEDLLDSIRLLQREVKINESIMMYLISPSELAKVRATVRWQEETDEYVVAPFILHNKKVTLPKLSQRKVMEIVQEDWKNRQLEFPRPVYMAGKDEKSDSDRSANSGSEYYEEKGADAFTQKKGVVDKIARNIGTDFFKIENKLPTLKQGLANIGRGDSDMKENFASCGSGSNTRHRALDHVDRSQISTSDTIKESWLRDSRPHEKNGKRSSYSLHPRKKNYQNVQLEPITSDYLIREKTEAHEEDHERDDYDFNEKQGVLSNIKNSVNFRRKTTLKPLSQQQDSMPKTRMNFKYSAPSIDEN